MRTLKAKTIKGLEAINDESMIILGDEEGALTQEPIMVELDPKLGTYIREITYWDDISRILT